MNEYVEQFGKRLEEYISLGSKIDSEELKKILPMDLMKTSRENWPKSGITMSPERRKEVLSKTIELLENKVKTSFGKELSPGIERAIKEFNDLLYIGVTGNKWLVGDDPSKTKTELFDDASLYDERWMLYKIENLPVVLKNLSENINKIKEINPLFHYGLIYNALFETININKALELIDDFKVISDDTNYLTKRINKDEEAKLLKFFDEMGTLTWRNSGSSSALLRTLAMGKHLNRIRGTNYDVVDYLKYDSITNVENLFSLYLNMDNNELGRSYSRKKEEKIVYTHKKFLIDLMRIKDDLLSSIFINNSLRYLRRKNIAEFPAEDSVAISIYTLAEASRRSISDLEKFKFGISVYPPQIMVDEDYRKTESRWMFNDSLLLRLNDKNLTNVDEIIECAEYSNLDFKFIKSIGRGKNSRVYLVYDSEIGENRALKILNENNRKSEEASTLNKLIHKNIVKVYAAGRNIISSERERFPNVILMEYVNGNTLREIIDNHPKGLDLRTAIDYSSQLLDGVEYLIKNKRKHCDLKPTNVKLNSDNIVKILDFGQSAETGSKNNEGSRAYQGSTDMFSWGLITYELVTGKHLLLEGKEFVSCEDDKDSIVNAMYKMKYDDGTLIEEYKRKIEQNLPKQLREPVIKALEISVNSSGDKYKSSNELQKKIFPIVNSFNHLKMSNSGATRQLKRNIEDIVGKDLTDNEFMDIKDKFEDYNS